MIVNAMLMSRKLSDSIEKCPRLYMKVQSIRYRNVPYRRKIVTQHHDLLIEGFPRCANSFAVQAFLYDNGPKEDVLLATHMHSPAHIRLATRWQVPSLVLIREPDEAVVSLLALAVQSGVLPLARLKEKNVVRLVRYWTRRFSHFYSDIVDVQNQFVLATFLEVITDFGSVIRAVNRRFRREFVEFVHEKQSVSSIFESRGSYLSPNGNRNRLKDEFRDTYLSGRNRPERDNAEEVFETILSARTQFAVPLP